MKEASLALAPRLDGSRWTGFDVKLSYDIGQTAAGKPLFSVPQTIVSIPGTPYRTEDLTVVDDAGPLTLTELPTAEGLGGMYRSWCADRDTSGKLRIETFAPVRETDERTPVGPLFDLRGEDLGLIGAGITFLPLPQATEMPSFAGRQQGDLHRISLRWRAPEGVQVISNRGLGNQQWNGPLQSLAFGFYAAGTPISIPEGNPSFGLHAFASPPFDLTEIAEYLHRLLDATSAFFEDERPEYRVLTRKNPFGTGGTALPGAFAFGFSASEASDPDELRSLLAHEMTHNWPHLDDDPDVTAWYSEGMAELYSHLIPLRAGLLSRERFSQQLNSRHLGYDSNPLRTLSNREANERAWVDSRAQRIPYGRGLNYLIATDAAIRMATDGARSLDDVVVGISRSQRAGELVGIGGWIERISEAMGDDARPAYESMAAGEPIRLAGLTLEGFTAEPVEGAELELGFDVASFRNEGRTVQALIPGSNAEAAGLREGDALVDRQLPYHVLRRSDREISIDVLRDGKPLTIRYLPAGAAITTVRWTEEH